MMSNHQSGALKHPDASDNNLERLNCELVGEKAATLSDYWFIQNLPAAVFSLAAQQKLTQMWVNRSCEGTKRLC